MNLLLLNYRSALVFAKNYILRVSLRVSTNRTLHKTITLYSAATGKTYVFLVVQLNRLTFS
jgi:hypothetical protein